MKKCLLIIPIFLCNLLVAQSDSLSHLELYKLGLEDAKVHYNGSRKANNTTLILSSLYYPVGLVPAITHSRKDIKEEEFNFPNQNLAGNLSYYMGYKENATKIKKKKIWNRFIVGGAINVTAYTALAILMNR